MVSLRKAKLYGGVGAMLLLLSGVVSILLGFILGNGLDRSIITSISPLIVLIVGYILILVAVKSISEVTNDKAIYSNAFYAVILFIIGQVVSSIITFLLFEHLNSAEVFSLLIRFFVIIVTLAIFYIVGSIFLKKSFYRIAELVKIEHFRTVGLLYFIGSILMVILIGGIIIIIAEILMIIAFFSIREQPPHIPPTPV
ncbi:MAG: DUF996 domain-containing protein [Thermoproteota archaeon]|jgi:uncharacterized membrane protein